MRKEEEEADPKSGDGRLLDLALAEVRRLGDFTTKPRVLLITGIAILVGTAGVIAGFVLLDLIRLFTALAYFGRPTLAHLRLGTSPLGWAAVAVPVVGGLIVGLMARYGTDKIRGHGIPEAIEAILLGRSRLDIKVAILKPLSSAIAIGTGGPFGAEGPIIMTGGAIGSLIGQALPITDGERKTLLVAGAAAGMTTVFGTPIAAMMIAVELLLFEWTPRSFIPVAAAAITAAMERPWLGLQQPLFPFHGGMHISVAGLFCWVLIGLVSGLLSGGLTRLVYACEDLFLKLPIHWMWWPAIGGLVVGIGGLIDPDALGLGYHDITTMLQGGTLPAVGVLLLVVKAVIWAMALGSGTSGGVLAPLLIMGGGLGAALTPWLPAASGGFWPLLGMAAILGGTMRSPLTATFFAVEVTGNTHVLLPLATACITSHLVTVLLLRRSILTEKIARRGHHLLREYRVDPFALATVSEVMTREVQTLPANRTLEQTLAFLADPATHHPSFPVIDEERRVLGVVDPPLVQSWLRAGKPPESVIGALLVGTTVPLAHPDEYLEGVITRMTKTNAGHVPVISREDSRLVGYLSWRDLLRAWEQAQQQEVRRTLFYHFGRHVEVASSGTGNAEKT
ncbi:MAG: chloride channel protein [Steroidobacteraceae bacterium]